MKSSLTALAETAKLQTANLKQLTKAQGVTVAEWQLLIQLNTGANTQEKLATAMQLDTSTLSRQLASLVKKEKLSKEAVGRDRRQLVYTITPAGLTALNAINAAYEQFEADVFDKWPQDEQNLLRILLNRLNKSVSRILEP
ncbi:MULTISPECIES: MarR family winged helix-turn-helix transcriptional regulator [Lactiplantibacillus]|uniref:MarR family transcriptional regulator n=1 Tax=Lactiplantibacillus pentosus TaxID=1589 RepID=A0AAW8WE78_LACPE|nr:MULTISPECIES: MarR family transcriptional regulator [Lactiplantibacillus]MBU7459801.1 MarR family transcriptional regulator [Lactiplantibacillus pentosus]MBU7477856.1 MarR family transcriptional regulator [Lactiplantibacillus pentosus]MBU7482502.1 MarR family transcriptional regulator [Lactiplantibacillus sp. 30.2.29]MBU7485694.1 MarR family transcriptional regulator [Lactiplantibacillus pentosus]MBU7498664.1 MarR family transcriptional regulator [Lactiplantibacillus pentosus]